MELELKILKEKVMDDEQKTGISSLFDDDKTSHQHIQLLKQKYSQMRRDFEQREQELKKLKLDVAGQKFILDSQITTIQQMSREVY